MNSTTGNQTCDTPLMRQYFAIKNQYADALLLFQVGDFYELFFDDAKTAASFLGITLTTRGKHKGESIPLCGVPVHALDHYLAKLVRGGFRVALCDQLGEPVPGKVVERGVTQVLTPGTLTDTKLLDAKSASYLLALYPTETQWGLVFGELLTAQLFATVIPAGSNRMLEAELARFFPDEIVIPRESVHKQLERSCRALDYFVSSVAFDAQHVHQAAAWIDHLKRTDSAPVHKEDALYCALKTFYAYMHKTQQAGLDQFHELNLYRSDEYLIIDAATKRNLELTNNSKDGGIKHTLFWAVDGAVTAMGSRMIKKWIVRPLVHKISIEQRQDVVRLFVDDVILHQHIADALSNIGDLERIVGRIALGRARVYDYLTLSHALMHVPRIKHLLMSHNGLPLVQVMMTHIDDFGTLSKLLIAALHEDHTRDWIIRAGFDQQLDYLRDLALNGHEKILALEQREQQATGIASLKIRYNQVQGYYIEITNTHKNAIPSHYTRTQTLAGRERFTCSELQHLQQQLVYAQAEATSLEKIIFERIKQEVHTIVVPLRKLAYALAHLDALLGFARSAGMHRYVCPTINDNRQLMIECGRHPVVERTIERAFIPNTTHLHDAQLLLIITGPNMGGKSTYLRQVALIALMAQCGSFVPAMTATLPLFDRIFTRIGAGDNLAEGKSTFLVEMEETAAICLEATGDSLVILDEVGRGTSTFDGLAIAQAVVEYLYTHVRAKALFATHYHELTALQDRFEGIVCYHAASTKTETGVVLLHTIVPGKADGSFGVEVARRTQMPPSVVNRAQEIMESLVQQDSTRHPLAVVPAHSDLEAKMALLKSRIHSLEHVIALLQDIQCDELSPRQAFELVCRLNEQLNMVQPAQKRQNKKVL